MNESAAARPFPDDGGGALPLAPALTPKPFDVIMLTLDHLWPSVSEMRSVVFSMLRLMVETARAGSDEYEEEGARNRPLGYGLDPESALRLLWGPTEWTLDNFISLLLTAEERRAEVVEGRPLRASDISELDDSIPTGRLMADIDGDGEDGLEVDDPGEGARSLCRPGDDGYLRTILGLEPGRFCALVESLLWLALARDSRARRLCFKQSNILVDFNLSFPQPQVAASINRHLPRLIGECVAGQISLVQLRQCIRQLCATGSFELARLGALDDIRPNTLYCERPQFPLVMSPGLPYDPYGLMALTLDIPPPSLDNEMQHM
jgi:hypothetical protein